MMVPSVFMARVIAHANVALEIAATIPVVQPVAVLIVIAAQRLWLSQETLEVLSKLSASFQLWTPDRHAVIPPIETDLQAALVV